MGRTRSGTNLRRLLSRVGGRRMSEPFFCPRRDEAMQAVLSEQFKGPDHWREPRNSGVGLGDTVETCSYCGSMNPDEVMAGLEDGTLVIGPTDKSYKAYISKALTDEQLAEAEAGVDAELEREKKMLAGEHDWENHRKHIMASRRQGPDIGKFYYMHLSEPQRQRYFELFKEDRIKYGYPGYAYTLPFFIGRGKNTQA